MREQRLVKGQMGIRTIRDGKAVSSQRIGTLYIILLYSFYSPYSYSHSQISHHGHSLSQ